MALHDTPTLLDEVRVTLPNEANVHVDPAPIERGPRYERGALLGEGGMGEVRRCRDRRIGRDVAVKTVRAEAASAALVGERFLREARVQGQLEHPCVVPVAKAAKTDLARSKKAIVEKALLPLPRAGRLGLHTTSASATTAPRTSP